jgi:hypothetical protein
MKFVLNDSRVRAACVEHILNIDISKKPIMTVAVAKFSKKTTSPQRRYYFGVIIDTISDYTGYTKEGLHDTFKKQLLTIKEGQFGELEVERTLSTTELPSYHRDPERPDIPSFFEYCEWICQFAAETIEIAIPFPNQKDFDV